MEFIAENYIWFIIGGIVILMAVVGYIADVTDFGRKTLDKQPKEKKEKVKVEKTKPEKVKKEKNKKEKIVEELPIIPNNIEQPENVIENIEQPIQNDLEQQDFSLEQNNIQQDNLFSNELFTNVNTEQPVAEEVDQSLFEPLPSVDQVFRDAEQPVAENITTEPVNIELPTEEVNQNSEIESDDDIWKF